MFDPRDFLKQPTRSESQPWIYVFVHCRTTYHCVNFGMHHPLFLFRDCLLRRVMTDRNKRCQPSTRHTRNLHECTYYRMAQSVLQQSSLPNQAYPFQPVRPQCMVWCDGLRRTHHHFLDLPENLCVETICGCGVVSCRWWIDFKF